MHHRTGQGEALAVWALWMATTIAVVVTYARVPPAETYNVTRDGFDGGLSRALVHVNYPIALVAVAVVLVAALALPRGAWWIGGPAIALCATVPFVVDQAHLDARPGNALPAIGVALAASLTVAATARGGPSFAPRLPGDPLRISITIVTLVLSLPWLSALVGFHLPGDVFMGEELFLDARGRPEAAVHLGTHHGLYGALLLVTALVVSRPAAERDGAPGEWLRICAAALAGYGAVNFVQDLWLEQVVKRGWASWRIPSAILPSFDAITVVWVALAGLAWWLVRRERAILRA